MARRNSYGHTTTSGFAPVSAPGVEVPRDALSSPGSDDLISAGLSFWPAGAAWGSPDGAALSLSSALARFTRVLMSPFEWLYVRAWQLALEANTRTVTELLTEWEEEYGLPERCFGEEQSTVQRLAALRRKVNASPLAHPEDFVRVAAQFGFEIEIEESCLYECGFSECGGAHEVGAVSEEAFIIVRVRGSAITYFEVDTSECGFDPLFVAGGFEEILCFLRQELPGWVIAIPEEWLPFAGWVSDDGTQIVTETRSRILFRL